MSEGKKEVAMQSLKSYLQQYPQGRYAVEAHFNLAELSREKGDMAQALLSYEQVIALAPNKYAERCLLAASRMAYFDKKDYKLASGYYKQLKESATSAANKLEGMRGLVRCQYYMESYADAVDNARELMNQQGAGADDKIFASLVLGKYAQSTGNCAEAVGHYRTVSSLSKAEYGAEARYQTAACLYAQGRYAEAEKAAFEVVKKDGSYVLWVTRSYLLLGDIFLAQKDYFNAKATYKSVAENSSIKELKDEAAEKLVKAEAEEAASSKVTGN
jgi:TolA-binding protein